MKSKIIIKKKTKRLGQSMVEFALVTPLLFSLVFGIVEFSYVGYHKIMMQYAAREWVRTESIGADQNNTDWKYATDGDATTAIVPGLSYQAFAAALSNDQIQHINYIKVFHVDPQSFAPLATSPSSITFDKYGMPPASVKNDVASANPSNWIPSHRCTGVPSDAFGVEVNYRHDWLTGFIPGGSVTMSEILYMRIEPQGYADSKPGCTAPAGGGGGGD